MGASNSGQQLEKQTAEQTAEVEKQYLDFAKERYARGDVLQKPLIDRATALTSNDPAAILSAAGPEVGRIAQAGQSAEADLYNRTGGKGAAFDFGMSQIPFQTYSNTAGYLNNIVNNAYGTLAEMGSGQYSVAGQQTGAGLSAANISAQTAGNLANQQAQNKASTMGFFGQLAGAASSPFHLG